jgi:hypothetical protein
MEQNKTRFDNAGLEERVGTPGTSLPRKVAMETAIVGKSDRVVRPVTLRSCLNFITMMAPHYAE